MNFSFFDFKIKPFFFLHVAALVISTPLFAIDTLDELHITLNYSSMRGLVCHLVFNGNFSGNTSFLFPKSWAYATNYLKNFKDILLEKGELLPEISENPYTFTNPPSKRLTLVYTIRPNIESPLLLYSASQEKDGGFFQAPGHALFAYPASLKTQDPPQIFMTFKAQEGWRLHHPLSLGEKGLFRKSESSIRHALYFAAREEDKKLRRTPEATIYFQGNFSKATQDELSTLISKIRDIYRRFFKASSTKPLLISLLEGLKCKPPQGTYFSESFTATIPSQLESTTREFLFHELLHEWMGQKMKKGSEMGDMWWAEGFTDYYSLIFAFRSGEISPSVFVKFLNQRLERYFSNPFKHASNKTIIEKFWSNPAVHDLPYRRGLAFALYLDSLIKRHTHHISSLDTLMQDLYAHTQKENCPFSPALFHSLSQRYIPGGIEKDLDTYIMQGGSIIPLESLPSYLGLRPKTFFNAGFQFAVETPSSEGAAIRLKITSVHFGSPAFKEGLRSGDTLVNWQWPNEETPKFFLEKEDKTVLEFPPLHSYQGLSFSPDEAEEAAMIHYFGRGGREEKESDAVF